MNLNKQNEIAQLYNMAQTKIDLDHEEVLSIYLSACYVVNNLNLYLAE